MTSPGPMLISSPASDLMVMRPERQKPVWWTWHAPRSGPVRIQTAGSSFDTLLAVYTGTAISNLALVASNDDTNGLLTSEVAFSAQAGTNYQIVVDGFDGASGSIVFTIIVDPPRLCLPLTVVGNQVQMCIAGEIGRTYTVEASPDLLNWTLIAAPLNSTATPPCGNRPDVTFAFEKSAPSSSCST